MPSLDRKNLVLAPWCERIACEEEIKARTKGDTAPDMSGSGGAGDATATATEGEGEQTEAPKGLTGAAKTLCIPFEQVRLRCNYSCVCNVIIR